jgi:hypothetical protein
MNRSALFPVIVLLAALSAEAAAVKSTRMLFLGETGVKINIYENPARRITFFAPHYNERQAARAAREAVDAFGGRLIEIESFDERGRPARHIKFRFGGRIYSIDPNRIYTENGRACGSAPDAEAAVRNFAEDLLKIILAPDGKTLREGEKFIVAVHTNADLDAKEKAARKTDLTAAAFVRSTGAEGFSGGAYQEQADGVYLSNAEDDADNFVFLSTPAFIGHFAEKGFNVVVQKSPARLQTQNCRVDDGSLSVYAAREQIPYINLEADGTTGAPRQKQMLEAVYELLN